MGKFRGESRIQNDDLEDIRTLEFIRVRGRFGARHLARALVIRVSVAGLCTAHSFTLKTVHPARLSVRDTRWSRSRLFSILRRQNSVFVRGRDLQRQPCQKQPSTKTATWRAGPGEVGFAGNRPVFTITSKPGGPQQPSERQFGGGVATRTDGRHDAGPNSL